MNVLDLFSGIGGFSLGLEKAGMRTVAFCEIEPYARAVLAKHWPNVPCYDDVRTLTADRLRADGIVPDLICGGFPCQDISLAGEGAGIEGEQSGLWSEYARIIGEVRPRFVIVENVSALLTRGLDKVLGDLAALRYDAEWHCIPASAVNAPHGRDRIWIVAHASRDGRRRIEPGRGSLRGNCDTARDGTGGALADAESITERPGLREDEPPAIGWGRFSYLGSAAHPWPTEPNVGRVADGVPSRVDRLTCLGNAVVPQIPHLIGEAIMALQPNHTTPSHDAAG